MHKTETYYIFSPGLNTPTDGTATIGDYSILTDMDQIRKGLGFCPQHNTLFEQLTVKEHLTFFLRLRVRWSTYMYRRGLYIIYV